MPGRLKLEDCLKKLRTSEGGGFTRFNERHLIRAARSAAPANSRGIPESKALIQSYLGMVDEDLKKVDAALQIPEFQEPKDPRTEKARAVVDSQKGIIPSAQDAWVGTKKDMLADQEVRNAFIRTETLLDPTATPEQVNALLDGYLAQPNVEGITFGGRTYILSDGVVVSKKDGSFEEAVKRVLRHEDTHVTIDSITRWNPKLKAEWEGLKKRVAAEKLDDLVRRRYPKFSNWRTNSDSLDNLVHEYFAEQMEREELGQSVDDPDLLQQFIAFMRKVLARVTGRDVSIEEIREFVRAGREARARMLEEASPYRASTAEGRQVPEMPKGSVELITHKSPYPGMTSQKIADYAWPRFYASWTSNLENPDAPLTSQQKAKLEAEWKAELADENAMEIAADNAYSEERMSKADFGLYSPEPSQTAPETGPRQTKRKASKTPEVTAEDIARRFPRFSLAEEDAAYMRAVESGDMETAQRMVDEAAKAAGYTEKVWHGSPDEEFTTFQKPETGSDEDGFWFSRDREWASKFGPTRPFFIKGFKTWGGDDFVVTEPRDIKSAEPVTRDESGQVIPLSQRFNTRSSDIRFSLAEQDPTERLREINEAFSYATKAGQQEGMDPTKATQDQRTFTSDGKPVDFSRASLPESKREALTAETIDLLSDLSPDGKSKTFGKDLMDYLSGKTDNIYGQKLNDFQQTSILNHLDFAVQERAMMGIDGAEVQRVRSQRLSQAGAILQTAASSIYEPLRDISAKAQELTDKTLKEEGVDPKKLDEEIRAEVNSTQLEIAKDISTPEIKASILAGAENEADDLWELGLSGMDPSVVAKVRKLDEWVVRLGQLRKLEAMLTGGPKGAKASLAALPDNLTLEQVRAMIAEGEAEVKKLTDEIGKSKKKDQRKAKEAKAKETEDNATFTAWVMGGESAGVDKFDDLILTYINPNGFNREQFTTLLTNSFKQADPNLIAGVVNRVADLLDGAATEEGIAADAAKTPNYDARAKRIVATEIAQSSMPEVMQVKKDPFTSLTKQRLKGEISAENFQKEAVKLGIEPESAYAYLQKVDQDRARIGDAKAQRELNAQAKKDMAAFRREQEQYARKTEATISQLSKEFTDTWSQTAPKDIDAYKKLLNNFIGKDGPPISEEQFIEEAKRLNIPEEGYTRLMGVLEMQRKRSAAVADAKAKIKQEEQEKREIAAFDRDAESTISKLSKEFSDTHAWAQPKDITKYKALLNNYLGVDGPPISEEEFIDGAKALRISESAYTRLLGVLNIQRTRSAAVREAKARQKAAEKAAAEAKKESEKSTKEAEAKIAALSKEFSDTLPSGAKQKPLTELQRLIDDYTGKNGPIISDEAFEERAQALNIPEGVLDRLRGVLQMQRKRQSLAADTKARQAEAERLEKERLKYDRETQREIDRLAVEFSDTLSAKKTSDISELKAASNAFLGKEGPPITEEEFLSRLENLNVTPENAQKLLKLLQESRRRDSAVRYAKAVQKAQESRKKAIESAVKKLGKTGQGNQTKLRQRSTFVNSILGLMEGGIMDSETIRQAFAQAYDLHGLTPEVLKDLGARLQQILAMKEGMVKETLLNEFNVVLNQVAPKASGVTHAHTALMGYILGGMNTMLMQLTGVNRFINPLSNTVEILFSAPGTTAEKIGRTMNPVNFFRLYAQGMREVAENLPQVQAGISGLVSSSGQGVGAMPSSLAAVKPREQSLSWTPWGQLSKYRFQTPKVLEQLGIDKFVQATRYPAWMVSRSFQAIRAAEGIVGGADKNMQWRAQMTTALMQKDPKLTWAEAYSRVSDALGDKTTEMWKDAYKQADEEIKAGTVAKLSRNQRATELVQDKIEEQWEADLKNRPREIAALYGYKQDPITPAGAFVYQGLSRFLNQDKGAMKYAKFSFLFARFFANAIETAYTRTPMGGLMALALPTEKPQSQMSDREKKIEEIYGSLGAYRDARMARAVSGTAFMGAIAGLMALALKDWDPDDDEAPFFWVTGDPIGEFSKKGTMEAGGWWKANTLYLGPLRINYVNASPEMATVMGAMGAIGDRFMFDKLLNYRENKETGEYERSNYEAYGKPVLEALAAPISRSTYRQWYDAVESAYAGDFKKMTRIVSNPVVGTAVALSPVGLIPSVKSLEKLDRSTEQPRTPRTSAQAIMASVPFASELGLDAGKPLTTPFGNPLTPYPFWSIFSNTQEVPPEVGKAAKVLADLGVSRLGPQEEYFGWGMAETAHNGKKFLLNDSQRARVLASIGTKFAKLINQNSAKLRKLESGKDGRDKVRDEITKYAKEARSLALAGFRPSR